MVNLTPNCHRHDGVFKQTNPLVLFFHTDWALRLKLLMMMKEFAEITFSANVKIFL